MQGRMNRNVWWLLFLVCIWWSEWFSLCSMTRAKGRLCVCALPEQRVGWGSWWYITWLRPGCQQSQIDFTIHNGELQLVAAGARTMSAWTGKRVTSSRTWLQHCDHATGLLQGHQENRSFSRHLWKSLKPAVDPVYSFQWHSFWEAGRWF